MLTEGKRNTGKYCGLKVVAVQTGCCEIDNRGTVGGGGVESEGGRVSLLSLGQT